LAIWNPQPRESTGRAQTGRPHIFNQYVIRSAEREEVRAKLKAARIGCEIYYPKPMHLQECFQYLGYRAGDLSQSETAADETLAIPCSRDRASAARAGGALALGSGLS